LPQFINVLRGRVSAVGPPAIVPQPDGRHAAKATPVRDRAGHAGAG